MLQSRQHWKADLNLLMRPSALPRRGQKAAIENIRPLVSTSNDGVCHDGIDRVKLDIRPQAEKEDTNWW